MPDQSQLDAQITCPLFVRSHTAKSLSPHWRFNGAGPSIRHYRKADAARAGRSSRSKPRLPALSEPGLVLEGGSIDVNGAGKLLTTEECLLSDVQARNPGLSRREYRASLGATTSGVHRSRLARIAASRGDDTHGQHRRSSRAFYRRPISAVAVSRVQTSPTSELMSRSRRIWNALAQPRAISVSSRLCPVLEPRLLRRPATPGELLPTSYIANGLVLVPTFGDPHDRGSAERPASALFPDRAVVGIPCRDLVLGSGRAPLHDPAAARLMLER